jgi:hypothetical protein
MTSLYLPKLVFSKIRSINCDRDSVGDIGADTNRTEPLWPGFMDPDRVYEFGYWFSISTYLLHTLSSKIL